jgi:hypothetical protein
MKQQIIFRNLFFLVSIVFIMSACGHSRERNISAGREIDSIASLFVPDTRMGICNIRLKRGEGIRQILAGETTSPEAKVAIIKALGERVNNLIDSIIILPDTTVSKKYMGLATLSVINVRKHPQQSAELVSQALLGTPVRILKYEDSWFLVQTPDNYLGWVEESSLVLLSITELTEWKNSNRVIVMAGVGWVYSAPDEKEAVGDIVAGCILVKEGEERGFTKISLPDGRTGYIESKSVTDFRKWKASVSCSGESIVSCASGFMGLPYLWGGSSIKGVDCSGFTKTVYFLNGLILYRDASQQALHGQTVDISEDYSKLRPGDLLFFGSMKNSRPRVTHVAIYKGDTEFIHSSGRVKINSLDSTRSNYSGYKKSFLLSAKRIIGSDDPGIVQISSHQWY